MKSGETFQVGNGLFSLQKGLLQDESGEIISLRKQSRDLLGYLCENANEIVTKDELIEHIWQGNAVTDGSIVQCIREIRRAVGDTDFQIVQTVPRQGYLLKLKNAEWQEPPAQADRPSILVLPFEDKSTGKNIGELSDVICDDIILGLTRFTEIKVLSSRTSQSLGESDVDLDQIRSKTGAHYILRGYQQKQGDRLRVGVELTDTHQQGNVWSERFQEKADDLGEAENTIASSIIASIGYLLTRSMPATGGNVLGRSARKFQEARRLVDTRTFENISKAEHLLKEVIETDPASHFPHASLCLLHLLLREFGSRSGIPLSDLLDKAKKHSRAAAELAPNDPLTILALSAVALDLGNHNEACAWIERAISQNPGSVGFRASYATSLVQFGQPDQALEVIEAALAANPTHADWIFYSKAFVLWANGKFEESAKYAKLPPNPTAVDLSLIAVILSDAGEIDQAKASVKALLASAPGRSIAMERELREKPFKDPDMLKRWLDALRRAGMPEE